MRDEYRTNVQIDLKNWPEIPDHSYKLLIIERYASEKKQSHYLI